MDYCAAKMHLRINFQDLPLTRFSMCKFRISMNRLFERYLRRLSPGSGMIPPAVPTDAASHYCSTMYERAGPPWDARCMYTIRVHRLRGVHRAYVCTRIFIRITNEAVVRTDHDLTGAL